MFVCNYNATGMAEELNGNPKRRLIREVFAPRLCPISIIGIGLVLLYLFPEFPNGHLDKIKLKQDLASRKMKYNLHQMALHKEFPPLPSALP